jgi:HSP20 family molecular chaperone IbpA
MGFVEPQGDVFETKKEIIITLDMQGVHEDALLIDVKETYVVIQAHREYVHTQDKGLHTVPLDYRLMLDLPAKVKPSTLKRTFHNGVLELRIEKR